VLHGMVGQLQTDASGNESIAATWLLTGDAAASDDWRSTTVGQDTFHRRSPAVVVGALATGLIAPDEDARV